MLFRAFSDELEPAEASSFGANETYENPLNFRLLAWTSDVSASLTVGTAPFAPVSRTAKQNVPATELNAMMIISASARTILLIVEMPAIDGSASARSCKQPLGSRLPLLTEEFKNLPK